MSNNELIRERAQAILDVLSGVLRYEDDPDLSYRLNDIRLHALHIKRLAGKIHPAKPGLDAPQRAG